MPGPSLAPPTCRSPAAQDRLGGGRRLTVGAPRRAGMAVHLHVATANGEGSLADSTSNFLLYLKQLQLNGLGMHLSLEVTQNDTEVHGCAGVTQTCEGNGCHSSTESARSLQRSVLISQSSFMRPKQDTRSTV